MVKGRMARKYFYVISGNRLIPKVEFFLNQRLLIIKMGNINQLICKNMFYI